MDPIERVRVRVREGQAETERVDALAVEEPLELRIRSSPGAVATSFVTTMRTPGHDRELGAGLLFAEGVLARRSDLVALERLEDPRVSAELRDNVLIATLGTEALGRAVGLTRGSVMGSACGVCGKTSIENVLPADVPPLESSWSIAPDVLHALPARLRERQSVFMETGGLHAAALFTRDGQLLGVREDIGRHNATDKLVGSYFFTDSLPLSDALLVVSGRAGFEIVQKAFRAGIALVASISAPSSLAVELAESTGQTLVGFLREQRFNVYAHSERIRSM